MYAHAHTCKYVYMYLHFTMYHCIVTMILTKFISVTLSVLLMTTSYQIVHYLHVVMKISVLKELSALLAVSDSITI